jgi:hypothetical protein
MTWLYAETVPQGDRTELRFLSVDDVGDIDQLVFPGAQHGKIEIADIEYVGYDTGGYRSNFLLLHRSKQHCIRPGSRSPSDSR